MSSDISVVVQQSPGSIGGMAAAASNCSMAMRVQKKVLSKLSRRGVVRLIANDRIGALMDTLYALLKRHYDQQTAEKVIKNIIKLTFKLGAMERENVLNAAQHQLLNQIERELRRVTLDLQSFQILQYSYNAAYLRQSLQGLQRSIRALVDQTLSDKSGRRVDHVFEHLCAPKFLAALSVAFPGFEKSRDDRNGKKTAAAGKKDSAGEEKAEDGEREKMAAMVQQLVKHMADLMPANDNNNNSGDESVEYGNGSNANEADKEECGGAAGGRRGGAKCNGGATATTAGDKENR